MHMPGEGENSQSKKETRESDVSLIFDQFLGLGLTAVGKPATSTSIPNSRT